jgi:hypothetical protein
VTNGRSTSRWPRSQRFALSGYGRTLVAAYRSRIRAARERGDHAIFESARAEWAAFYDLRPDDGMYLAEIEARPMTLCELRDALEICNQSRDDVARSVGLLVDARLVVPVRS